MKMIHAMILNQRAAKRYAGKTVAEMIRQGCCARVMRMRRIPESVFHWTLGSRVYLAAQTPEASARLLMDEYRADYLGLANHQPQC